MELMFKAVATALSAALIGLFLKKFNPELSGLISLCTISIILIATVNFAAEFKTLISDVRKFVDISDVYIVSILKCLAVSILTRLTCDMCRDAGQAALSSTVEFAGCICAALVVLPLITNMIDLVGSMV